ncbi:MAG: DUF4388 domain-containing protein [Oscillochloris sp.]|nr:DUF4388 domain-containing protein [Oscillochloris sp.]
MKLEGTIDTIPLRELIDMIAYSSVTGALNLYASSATGHVYFRDGNLYHADFGDAAGLEALSRLFEISSANFSFVGDVTCEQETLWGDMDYHVRTAERLAQRWQHIRTHIPSLHLVPILIVPFETALRRVGTAQHQVLDRIDGQHSLKAIVDDLGWAEIDVAEAVAQMARENLVDLRDQTNSASTSSGSGPCGSLFDRLIARSGDSPRQPMAESPRISSEEMVLRALRG